MMKRFAWCLVLCAACNGDDVLFGPDGSTDATTPDAAKMDASKDVVVDAPIDAPADATTDAALESSTDASDASDATDAADTGASWHSPTCDGVISTNEYGDAKNATTSGQQTWYMTWDATNLYVALDGAALNEANVVYVGDTGAGVTNAQTYDSTGGTLPFPADAVFYAKDGYQEVRLSQNDAGTWGNAATSAMTYCSNGTVREEAIPWTSLGATSIPSSFRFLAYATSSSGFVYAQIPTTNAGGNIGTTYAFPHDFYVASTSNGTGSFPFDTTE
jgi:hypothetical protein